MSETKKYGEFSQEELAAEAKKFKKTNVFDAFAIGLLIGISIYSMVNNGFGILVFLPLVYFPIATKNRKRYLAFKDHFEARNREKDGSA